jgi:hypothetical protein
MRMGRKLTIIAVVLGTVMVALGSLKIYFIREDSSGNMLWTADETYLFMDVFQRGARVSYLEYPWILLKQHLYGVRPPDDQRTSVMVVRVTPSGVEHHVVEMLNEHPGNTPALYTAFEDQIYANCEGYLCKWTGSKFEAATQDEQHRLDETRQLIAKDTDKGARQWSQRAFGEASNNYQFAITVGKEFTLEVTNRLQDQTRHSILSIDVVRPGQTAEPILRFDGRPRRVSKTEYEQEFTHRDLHMN